MKNILIWLLPVAFLLQNCDSPSSNSLFDKDAEFNPDPTIASVSPANGFFAGYLTVTINGSNFSTVAAENNVWFNNRKATVVSATATQLVVNTPNYVADSIQIKVNVDGALAYSNSIRYKLEALYENATSFAPGLVPYVAAVGPAGEYYVSVEASGLPAGVSVFNSTGVTREAYTPAQSFTYRAMKYGPDGGLYMLRVTGGESLIRRSPPNGGATTTWASGIGRPEDLDFDEQDFLWLVGSNEGAVTVANRSIVRVQNLGASRALVRYPFDANGTAVKVYNGYLYVGGTRANVPYIWRFPINSSDNSLGAEETVVNLGTAYNANVVPRSLAFATDGTLFVSVSGNTAFNLLSPAPQPLLSITPAGVVSEQYADILPGVILKMHWIPGTQKLLMTLLPVADGQTQRLITLNMQKDGAPYYGIQ
jgi:hypothetical protein